MRRAWAAWAIICATSAPVKAELFLEAFGGRGINLDSDLRLFQPGSGTDLRYRSVEWEDRSFDPSPYYGYRVGYFLESLPWLGARVQFMHHKALARTSRSYHASGTLDGVPIDTERPLRETVQWFEVTHGLNLVTVAAMARWCVAKDERHPRGRTQFYGGFGMGPVITHAESTVRGKNHETGYTLQDSPALEGFIGMRAFLTPRWLALLEYKATHARVRAEVADARVDASFNSHHLTFGVGFSFR